jgi:anti-sigma B factor antagonist
MIAYPSHTSPPLDHPPAGCAVHVTRHDVGRRTVLCVAGEIDMATAPAITRAIDAALATGALELWIDLTPTAFMDSSGVHVLLAAQRRLCELNRRFAVICPEGCIRRLFEATGVTCQLRLYLDRAQAHRDA